MAPMRSRRRAAALPIVLVLAAALVAGCDSGEMRERYEAERTAWRTHRLAWAMRANPELATDEMRARVEGSYEAIVRRHRPPERGQVLSREGRDIAAIAAQSRLALAGLVLERGNVERAVQLYASVKDSYSFDRGLSIEAYLGAGNALEAANRWPEAVRFLEELTAVWWPAPSPPETPDPRILRTPLKLAAGYLTRGEPARAAEWYARAEAYYDKWIVDWEGSRTAALALELKGEGYAQQGRYREAADAYEALDRQYGTAQNRAALWLRIAEIYDSGLDRPGKARDYYLMVTEAYADEVAGATAEIAIARLNIEDGEYPAARLRLEKALAAFKEEKAIAATALHYLALSHELEGSWERALPWYAALAQEHPTTLYGLMAPLHIAQHYEGVGAADAAAAAYARAVEHYERVIREHASSPAELAARSYLVETLIEEGEWGKAADSLVETARRFSDSEAAPAMLLQAADLYEEKLGDKGRAREALEALQESYSETPAARAAAARLSRLQG